MVVALAVIVDSGARAKEVVNLAVAQVYLDNLLLTVHRYGDKERKVPFSFELRKILFRQGHVKNRHGIVSLRDFNRFELCGLPK